MSLKNSQRTTEEQKIAFVMNFFFARQDSLQKNSFEARKTQRTSSSRFIIMLRKGVNNGRSKLSSVMKKDKSKNSTYILVNQVRFHLRFCCVFFVFLSSLSSSRLMMMRIGKATTGRVVLCSI